MRIISNFRDYYDSVQGVGFDDHVVYERRTTSADVRSGVSVGGGGPRWTKKPGDGDTRQPSSDEPLLPAFHRFRPFLETKSGDGSVVACVLYLAGRAYPFWRYSPNGGSEFVASFEDGFDAGVSQRDYGYFWDRGMKVDKTPWRDWLASHWGEEIDPAIHFHNQSPLLLYLDGTKIADPCLRDFNIQRALDPYSVFQELDMFLGGVMAQPRDPPAPMLDKEKIVSHGMDVKRSFRNMPRS
jgi:hypothetical protein